MVVTKETGNVGVFIAVSDGMGGARAGDVASRMAVESMFETLSDLKAPLTHPEDVLRRSIQRANETVFQRSETDVACRGMGTTLTGVLLCDGSGFLGHVGDSRAYLFQRGILRQLTHDHSLLNFLIDYGVMSSDQAESQVNRNIILEALGVKKDVRIDIGCLTLEPHDTILLCTDGLYSTMADAEIQTFLESEPDLARLTQALIDEANRRGGPDNITVVLGRVEPA